ncbi:hypothetical protein HNO89_004256 [Sporosarcina luteola]|nr:hypothetical protein [Sporosarcina luteola]
MRVLLFICSNIRCHFLAKFDENIPREILGKVTRQQAYQWQ